VPGERPQPRYQSASEIRADLLRLKRDSDSGRTSAAFRAATCLPPGEAAGGRRGGILALLAATAYWYAHRPQKLTDKDNDCPSPISPNTTGDAMFDGTLRQGLAVQLAQVAFPQPCLRPAHPGTLRQMGQGPDARLDLGSRSGNLRVTSSSAVARRPRLEASVVNTYCGLRARNCRTGEVLGEEQAQVARKEDVLVSLSQLASKFRARAANR